MIIVKIDGASVLFSTQVTNYQQFMPIEALKLSKEGILKEHPDLKDKDDMEIMLEGTKRFKEHIKSLGNEEKIKDYIIDELSRCGYVLKTIQKKGFRAIKIGGEI